MQVVRVAKAEQQGPDDSDAEEEEEAALEDLEVESAVPDASIFLARLPTTCRDGAGQERAGNVQGEAAGDGDVQCERGKPASDGDVQGERGGRGT